MDFVDTNIFLYAAGDEPSEKHKRNFARATIDAGDIATSVQVLQEFFVQATRPSRARPMPAALAKEFVETWQRFPVQSLTPAILNDALTLHLKYKFSYWDCAVISAAKSCSCTRLLTEDMTHGQKIEGLTVVNPFAAT